MGVANPTLPAMVAAGYDSNFDKFFLLIVMWMPRSNRLLVSFRDSKHPFSLAFPGTLIHFTKDWRPLQKRRGNPAKHQETLPNHT